MTFMNVRQSIKETSAGTLLSGVGDVSHGPGAEFESLRRQLRETGVVLIVCDSTGKPLTSVLRDAERRDDWITEMLCRSKMFVAALQRAMAQWHECETAEMRQIEALPGIWLVPPPVVNGTGGRRRLRGAETEPVVVIVTRGLFNSEHFVALCQSVACDATLARSFFEQLPPANDDEVQRLIALVRQIVTGALQLAATEQAIDGTGRQLAESYEEISLLYTIIQSMTVVQQPHRFVSIACEELLNTLPYGWIGAILADDESRLKGLSGRFITTGDAPPQQRDRMAALAKELLAEAVADAPVILQPGGRGAPNAKPEHRRYRVLGSSVLVHPVSSDGRVIGLLLAGEKHGPDTEVSSVDIKLLGATATHMAIFLENAALYDDLNAMFLGTLEALTASIDAKDRYTCGHSQRVAHLTQQLAKAAGVDEALLKRMRIAGLVHDVGKIGVPEHVLLKPGKLTEEEFEWIRRHPEMGYRILKDIPQLKDILPGVLHHHERWDGRGYPSGLQGEEIPMVARLIALADSFDAMSSTRTYRSGLHRSSVLKEIERCAGTQFDPDLVKCFLQLDFTEYDRLAEEHHAAPSEGKGKAANGPRRAA